MRQRDDDDILHHSALLWNVMGGASSISNRHGGFLIPRQVSGPIVQTLRDALPSITAEEAMAMALAPRVLRVDLAYLADPKASHDGRGLSEQTRATPHMVWPSFCKEGEGLATMILTIRCGFDAETDDVNRIAEAVQKRLRSHLSKAFKRGYKISEENARLLCAGRMDLREGFAKTCEDLGLAAELERDLPKAPSAPTPRL